MPTAAFSKLVVVWGLENSLVFGACHKVKFPIPNIILNKGRLLLAPNTIINIKIIFAIIVYFSMQAYCFDYDFSDDHYHSDL